MNVLWYGLSNIRARFLTPRYFVWLIFLGLAGLAWLTFHVPSQQATKMNNFSSDLRTHCLGRYLIDLPVDLKAPRVVQAEFYFGLGSDFETVEIRVPEDQPTDARKYREQVNYQVEELSRRKNDALLMPMLVEKRSLGTPNGDVLMVRMLSNDYNRVPIILSELHAFVGGRYLVLSAHSYPPEKEIFQNASERLEAIDPIPAEDRLIMMAELMRPVGQSLGSRNGFCISGILFDPERMGYSEEKADFEFTTENGPEPGLRFKIQMNGMLGYGTETLHQRTDQIAGIMLPFILQVVQRTVRRRTRTVEGVEFQEWANMMYYRKSSSTEYSFSIQNSRPAAEDLSFERPAMSIDLDSGTERISSPHTLHQLEAGWDQWLSTLRIAPGNGGKRS